MLKAHILAYLSVVASPTEVPLPAPLAALMAAFAQLCDWHIQVNKLSAEIMEQVLPEGVQLD